MIYSQLSKKTMNKLLIIILVLSLIVIYGCTSPDDKAFKEGVNRINEINSNFDTSMKTIPNAVKDIDELLIQLIGFAASDRTMPQSLNYLLDFRIKSLEAEKLHSEGWQWGRASTTEFGFGCRKGTSRIINSSNLRNASAQKGFESLEALKLLVDDYPKKAKSLNLSQKDIIFLNAAYTQVRETARKDARTIRGLCKEQYKALFEAN